MTAFLTAVGIVFLAELGDKSQLMAMAFATRYRASRVILGVTLAALGVNLLSVLVGRAIGATLAAYSGVIALLAGLAFLGFALWTLIDTLRDEDEDGEQAGGEATVQTSRFGSSAVLVVATAFLVAELGDRTMLATAALALQNGIIPTWLGSTVGLVAASSLGVVFGAALGRKLSGRVVGLISAGLFAVFGIVMVVAGVLAL